MEEELTKSRHANRYRILTAVMLGGIMGPIDASVINVNYHIIGNHFGVALTEAQWVVMVYLLTVSSLLLFYGRLGDILGYKNIFNWSFWFYYYFSPMQPLLFFTLYFLVNSFRAIQGTTAGMMMSVPYAIIVSSFLPRSEVELWN